MINISQHLCLPLGQYRYQKYINNYRVLTNANRTLYGCIPIQDFPMFQSMNKYVSFNDWVNIGTVNVLRMWPEPDSARATAISSAPSNGTIQTLVNSYAQYAVINSNDKDNKNYQVLWLFWKEPVSSLSGFSLDNAFTSDVINDEVEM